MVDHEIKKVPLINGWYSMDAQTPHLIGNRCKVCGDYFFPKVISCRNPNCRATEMQEVPLSTRGKLWSFTTNYYQPPPPYVSPQPFVPYTIAVVDLPEEKLMVLGQVAEGCDPEKLKVGMEMELVFESLYKDEQESEHIVWKWKPAIAA